MTSGDCSSNLVFLKLPRVNHTALESWAAEIHSQNKIYNIRVTATNPSSAFIIEGEVNSFYVSNEMLFIARVRSYIKKIKDGNNASIFFNSISTD